MRVSAIIVAAGSGSRLGANVPKAFVTLGEHTLLWYSLRILTAVSSITEAIVTVPAKMESRARAEVVAAGLEIPVKLVEGGVERQDSVRIALEFTSAESDLVIVHDAARPMATPAMFEACLAAAARADGAIVATPLADTLKQADNSVIIRTVARAGLWRAQTPQAFGRAKLKEAHRHAVENGIAATDDADLVEQIGGRVELVKGSDRNMKITTSEDLEVARILIARESSSPT